MALGSVTTSTIFIRPSHLEQTVTSTAKTRASRFAQLMDRHAAVLLLTHRSTDPDFQAICVEVELLAAELEELASPVTVRIAVHTSSLHSSSVVATNASAHR